MIEFYKYQGTGNDFILIDNRSHQFKGSKTDCAKHWCDRRFGIGSDGLIFIENDPTADFKMDFYNPDGSRSFCGNGSRCAVRFARDLGIVQGNSVTFNAIDGIHKAMITDDHIRIRMNDVSVIEHIRSDYFINTGSPHYISYEGPDLRDIVEFGRSVRFDARFNPGGTNVNLVEEMSDNHIRIRTYERGVEAETYSCGTGATACAISYAAKHDIPAETITVDVRGGRLNVSFKSGEGRYTDIWLQGPAVFVFKGVLNDHAD